MPIFVREKILLAKIESQYGDDPTPANTDAILAKDFSFSPMEGQDIDRDLERGYFGSEGTIPADLHSKLSFSVELAGSGAKGTSPPWDALIRACGLARTIDAGKSVKYNPITKGAESITLHFFLGKTRHVMKGTRGTAMIELNASAVPMIMFEFTGLFSVPTEENKPTPNYTKFMAPKVASTANTPTATIATKSFPMRNFKLDFGNEVTPRFLVGEEAVLITERTDMIEMQVEAQTMTDYDPFTGAQNATKQVIEIVHGTQEGHITTIDVPKAQLKRPGGVSENDNIFEWPLSFIPTPTAGNDQWTITLT